LAAHREGSREYRADTSRSHFVLYDAEGVSSQSFGKGYNNELQESGQFSRNAMVPAVMCVNATWLTCLHIYPVGERGDSFTWQDLEQTKPGYELPPSPTP